MVPNFGKWLNAPPDADQWIGATTAYFLPGAFSDRSALRGAVVEAKYSKYGKYGGRTRPY